MNDLVDIVDSLENKISKLLHKHELLKQSQLQLEDKIAQQDAELKKLTAVLEKVNHDNQTLKAANAMLGSNDYKRETKLKINSLIREIDQCIVQLSE